MISHQLSWGGEDGVENLPAGPSFHRATEILGLFWEVQEQTAFPCLLPAGSARMFGTVTCCARGSSCEYLGSLRPFPGWEQGCSFPCPSVGCSRRAEGCPERCCVTGSRQALAGGCPFLIKPSPG